MDETKIANGSGIPTLYDVDQVAAALHVQPNCVYRYRAAGLLRSRHNHRLLCYEQDIIDCLEKLGTPEGKRRMAAHMNRQKTQRKGRPAGSAEVRRLQAEGKL